MSDEQEPPRQWEDLDEFEALADAEFSKWRQAHERLAACDFGSLAEFEHLLAQAAGVDPATWTDPEA